MSLLLTKFYYISSDNIDTSVTDINNINDVEITDVNTIQINLGLEFKNNRMDLTLTNPPINLFADGMIQRQWIADDGTEAKFRIIKTKQGQIIDEELITAYAEYTDTDPTLNIKTNTFLLMTGIIEEGVIKKNNANEDIIELKCIDRNKVLLDKMTFPQRFEPDAEYTAPILVQRLIRLATNTVPGGTLGYTPTGEFGYQKSYLVDARLFSDGIKSSGTAVGNIDRKVTDAGATFITDGVEPDMWVRNTVTNEYAFIIAVNSETELLLDSNIFPDTEGYEVSDGFIQDTRPGDNAIPQNTDGSSEFPVIRFSRVNQALSKTIEELSSTLYTNSANEVKTENWVINKGMRFYVDRLQRVHWYMPGDSPKWYMEIGASEAVSPDLTFHQITSHSVDNSQKNNVNFIIFKAGEDMNNNQIKGYARARYSGAPQTKDSFRSYEDVAREMKIADKANLTFIKSDEYDYPSSYPVTPKWDDENRSVDNDSEYNTNFKEVALRQAEVKAQKEFSDLANPRWAGKINMRGSRINVSDLINFTDKEKGINNVLLRVTQVSHVISHLKGWVTNLTVEEDELAKRRILS